MNISRKWSVGVFAVLGVLLSLHQGHAEEKEHLNLLIWNDYITKEALTEFETQAGIKVTVDVFDSNEMLEAKLFAGKSGYDLVVPTSEFLKRQIEAGVYRPLDKAQIPNLANLDKALMKKVERFDPENRHSIIYMWGTNGFGYNPEKVAAVAGSDAPVDSWDLIFDPKWAKKVSECGLYVMDSPTEVFPSVLQYLGLDPNTKDAENLTKAENLLLKIRPYVTRFDSSEYINALANGDVCVAMGYSGDVLQASARAEEAQNGVKVEYIVPKEGAPVWFDMLAVPKDAPHPDNAMAFINHFLKPHISAQVSNYIQYANANAKSLPLLDVSVRENPGIYPPSSVLNNLFIHEQVDQKTVRLLTRSWNRIKTGY